MKKVISKKSSAKKVASKKVPAKKKVLSRKTATEPQPSTTKPSKAIKKPVSKKKPKSPNVTRRRKTVPSSRPRVVRKAVNLQDIKISKNYKPSAKEAYMSSKHLAYFSRKLTKWRDDLIIESQETLEHLRTETRDVGDEAERASRESDNILELRTRDRYRKLLRKIEEALKRVEEGVYGYCEETGEEIGLGRLEARPIATLTVDAQERREIFQKQFRDDR